ncbi:transglutaminase domain-containing protein [Lignipirellula cremea]|nr:transglutaminase domain-containing protein [Lignipirellula cremea]
MQRALGAIAFLALAIASLTVASARTWTDATGKFRMEAELVSANDSQVVLKTTDGRELTVPLAQLSRNDRVYLARIKAAGTDAPTEPTEPTGSDSATDSPNAIPMGTPGQNPAPGQSNEDANGPQYGEPVTLTIVKGVRITTPGGARGVTATFPIPATWPEQAVEELQTDHPASVQRAGTRDLPGGSQQIVLSIPLMKAGEVAEVANTYRVQRRPIEPPADTSRLQRPPRPVGELRQYLGASPGIQTANTRFRKTAEEIAAGEVEGWALVKKTFDWVRANMKYVGGELRGALWAAEHGQGDCEEYTSLFIALSRANGVPARAVWVPGHCYAEFYLEDASGRGWWFPCDALQENEPGRLRRTLPILQKGDSFEVPELRGKQRYLSESLTARDVGRGAPPQLEAILRNADAAP